MLSLRLDLTKRKVLKRSKRYNNKKGRNGKTIFKRRAEKIYF